MSQAARLADPAMLEVRNLNYDSWQTVYFQRTTVILSELVLVYALSRYVAEAHGSGVVTPSLTPECHCRYVNSVTPANKALAHIACLSILLSPGLLIIDHIHFQYNGFLYGILVLSIVLARKQSTLLHSGITFAVLLCLKHIYLYLSLAYFVYLLRAYCLDPKSMLRPRFGNAIKLGVSVLAVFGAAFGPFAVWNQLPQLKDRLFPFSRGLCHAYWAPNIWAMYSFVDRVLIPRQSPTIVCASSVRLLTVSHSRAAAGPSGQARCVGQCHSRLGGRHVVCGPSRDHQGADVPLDFSLPDGMPSHDSLHVWPTADESFSSSPSSSSGSGPTGKRSSAPSLSAATPPSSSAGTCTKRPFS